MDRPEDFTTRQFEGFDGAFDEIRFKGESSERFKGLGVGQEVQKPHIEDSVVVVISGLKRVVGDDELLEGVAGVSEREGLLCPFFGVWDHVCGLDVDSARSAIDDKVDFIFWGRVPSVLALVKFNDADIDGVAAACKFVEDDILHQMCFFILPKVDRGISQSGVDGVVLHRVLEIVTATDIKALGVGKDEGFFECGKVLCNSRLSGDKSGFGFDGIREFVGIGRTRNGAHGEVDDMFEQNGVLNLVALNDVSQVDGLEKSFEIGFLLGDGRHERTFWKAPVDEIVIQSGEGIGTLRGELAKLGKRERSDMNNLAASAKLGGHVSFDQARVGPGHIDVGIGHGSQLAQNAVKGDVPPIALIGMNTGWIYRLIPFTLAHLDFVNENIVASSIVNQPTVDVVAQRIGRMQMLMGSAFQVDFNDMVFRDAGIKQMLLKKSKQKEALPATAQSCQNLDKIVTFGCDKLVQQFTSLNSHFGPSVLIFSRLFVNFKAAEVYHNDGFDATANFFHFPRHILCTKHEYIMESMEKKDTKAELGDESFDFHLDPNRIRTVSEIQLFADVFSISFEEARRILTKAGRRCEV